MLPKGSMHGVCGESVSENWHYYRRGGSADGTNDDKVEEKRGWYPQYGLEFFL